MTTTDRTVTDWAARSRELAIDGRAVIDGRRVDAALLYTAGPKLMVLSPELLRLHKPGLAG